MTLAGVTDQGVGARARRPSTHASVDAAMSLVIAAVAYVPAGSCASSSAFTAARAALAMSGRRSMRTPNPAPS